MSQSRSSNSEYDNVEWSEAVEGTRRQSVVVVVLVVEEDGWWESAGSKADAGWMDLWLRIRARSSEQTFGDDLRSQRKL